MNKNKNNKKKQAKQPNKQVVKATPFRDAGKIVGSAGARFFGIPGLKDLGALLGTGIGRVFGSGDYEVVGMKPSKNVFSGQTPQFSTTKATNIVCHREYIGDINGTTNFTLQTFPINPGLSTSFPWLSGVASNYSQYRIHGLMYEFKPLITDFVTSGAPGVVIMSTNYNSDDPVFTTKRQMENSEFAVSIKPTEKVIHMIECDPKQTSINELYIRQSSPPTGQDLKTYDLGNFQLATQGNPTQLLGELWVTYCVEFFKPEVALISAGGSAHASRYNAVSTTVDFGIIQAANAGSISSVITPTVATYSGLIPSTKYMFVYTVQCSGTVSPATVTVTTGSTVASFMSGTTANSNTQTRGTGFNHILTLIARSDPNGTLVLTNGIGSTTVGGTVSVDMYLTYIDQNLN